MATATSAKFGLEQQAANAKQAEVIQAQSELLERQQKLILTFIQILNDNGLSDIIDKTASLRFTPPAPAPEGTLSNTSDISYGPDSDNLISWTGSFDDLVPLRFGDQTGLAMLLEYEFIGLWNDLLNLRYKIPVFVAEYKKEKALAEKYYAVDQKWIKRRNAGESFEVWDVEQMTADEKTWQRAQKRANDLVVEIDEFETKEKSVLRKLCRRIGQNFTRNGIRDQEDTSWIEHLQRSMMKGGEGLLSSYVVPMAKEDFDQEDTDEEDSEGKSSASYASI